MHHTQAFISCVSVWLKHTWIFHIVLSQHSRLLSAQHGKYHSPFCFPHSNVAVFLDISLLVSTGQLRHLCGPALKAVVPLVLPALCTNPPAFVSYPHLILALLQPNTLDFLLMPYPPAVFVGPGWDLC